MDYSTLALRASIVSAMEQAESDFIILAGFVQGCQLLIRSREGRKVLKKPSLIAILRREAENEFDGILIK